MRGLRPCRLCVVTSLPCDRLEHSCFQYVGRSRASPAPAPLPRCTLLPQVLDLFVALDASDDQLDFPTVYASAREGWSVPDLALKGPT